MAETTKNVFTELFGGGVSPGIPKGDSSLLNAVTEHEAAQLAKPAGIAPGLSKGKAEVHPKKPGATFFKASLLILVVTVFGFLTQNSTRLSLLGVNPALRVEQAQNQVAKLTAEVRVQNHLAATLLLDQFSKLADEYFYKTAQAESDYSSENKRADFEQDAQSLRPELLSLLAEVQAYLNEDIPNEEMQEAKTVIEELVSALQEKRGTVDEQTLLQDIQDLETAKTLMQSQSFKSMVGSLNSESGSLNSESATDEELKAVSELFGAINESVSALISQIMAQRKDWSSILEELENLTKSVDPLFNTEFPGNLELNELRFSADGSLTVSGETITDDSKNFTLVSNLIDTYETSELFQNVRERNFNKAGENAENSFTGNFTITMELESNS